MVNTGACGALDQGSIPCSRPITTLLLVTAAAFVSTLLGGALALSLKDHLHLVLGFSAGAVVAVAFFDLLPEALTLGSASYDTTTLLTVTALGFFAYLILDRVVLMHGHADDHIQEHRGVVGAGSLAFHSFLDGIAIGLAFQASSAVGLIVAAAVLTHDFSDGINTVNMVLKNGGTRTQAMRWLYAGALAPVLGVVATLFFTIEASALGLLLALFAGFFLYMGASDLIPESHHAHPVRLTTIMTIIGALVLYVAIRFAGA